MVWKHDREWAFSKRPYLLVSSFRNKGVESVCIKDGNNTRTATGRFTFNIFASLAEFEREIIRERTTAGLKTARARGRKGGKPTGLFKEAKSAKILKENGEKPVP